MHSLDFRFLCLLLTFLLFVHTDLSISCPAGTYARIAPRSGLAVKKGIDVGAGVVDADYRGPVGTLLIFSKSKICHSELIPALTDFYFLLLWLWI